MYTYNVSTEKQILPSDNYNYALITLKGVFFAIIIFCASFLAPYIGCNYQFILKQNVFMRYMLLFLVIFFSVNLVDPSLGLKENPLTSLFRSIFVFCIFLLLNKLNVTLIVLLLTLFAILILTSKFYYYYKNMSHENPEKISIVKLLDIIQIVLFICIIFVIGLSLFLKDKYDSKTSITLEKCNIHL